VAIRQKLIEKPPKPRFRPRRTARYRSNTEVCKTSYTLHKQSRRPSTSSKTSDPVGVQTSDPLGKTLGIPSGRSLTSETNVCFDKRHDEQSVGRAAGQSNDEWTERGIRRAIGGDSQRKSR